MRPERAVERPAGDLAVAPSRRLGRLVGKPSESSREIALPTMIPANLLTFYLLSDRSLAWAAPLG
jgi:hypothetical protein